MKLLLVTYRKSASSKLERMRADGNPAPLSERGDEVFKELHHNMGFSAELSRAAVTQTSCAPAVPMVATSLSSPEQTAIRCVRAAASSAQPRRSIRPLAVAVLVAQLPFAPRTGVACRASRQMRLVAREAPSDSAPPP